MKPRSSNQTNRALTLVEVLLVIVVLAILAAVLLRVLAKANRRESRINCVNNLKEIGLAYRVWEGDNGDKYPMFVSVTNGGVMELIATGNVAACFQVMSNELSTPKILVCQKDADRIVATNFTTDFDNNKISYFVNPDAAEAYPQMMLSGDDNFEIGGVSVKSGLRELSTNAPISWTAARHKFVGNLCFADGSVQQVTQSGLRSALVATNRLAIP
jgi:prepilin-type N-terminal cleavage/methylation domain-containing protein/prepilin-type processing-associated H-X9-DG protein